MADKPKKKGRSASFLIIWGGQFISIIGSGLTNFGIIVWLFEKTGAATPFAMAILTATLPAILLAPIAGSLADRFSRKRIMILGDSGDALLTLAVLGLVATGRLEPWMIYLVTFLGSSFSTFQGAAYQAAIPTLVPKEGLARANGLVSFSQATSGILPPILAGALFGLIGLKGLILIDVASYLFAIGALLFVRIPRPAPVESAPSGQKLKGMQVFINDAAFGFRYLWAKRPLLLIVTYFALVNFCINLVVVLSGPLVIATSGAAGYGIVQTAFGLGALAGGLVLSVWGGPKRRKMAWVVGGLGCSAFGLALAGIRPGIGFAISGLFLMIASIQVGGGIWSALIQAKIEPGAQGRVMAARSIISQSLMPVAYIVAGPLADRIFGPLFARDGWMAGSLVGRVMGTGPGRGIGFIFVLSGLLLALGSIRAATNPRLMRLDEEMPDLVDAGGDPEVAVTEKARI